MSPLESQPAIDRPLAEVCSELGITARQADHWIRRGYLDVTGQGSGRLRRIRDDEARVLRVMARLVQAGMRWEEAAGIARHLPGGGMYRLGAVTITVDAAT